MKIDFTPESVIIDPAGNPGAERVLRNHFKAPKLKAGYRLPKTLWLLREIYKTIPEVKDNPEFMMNAAAERMRHDNLAKQRAVEGNGSLRPYQNQDAQYLTHIGTAGVFNEPRTGKTPTIIEVLRKSYAKKVLIVCPASLIYNWKAEIEKFWSGTPIHIAGSKDFNIWDGVTIVSKDTLKPRYRKDPENPKRRVMDVEKSHSFNTITKGQWDVCVVDEAHFLRNYETDQCKAIFRVKAERRYALTGTPVVNNGDDMYGILHFLYPKMFPSYWQFVDLFFEVDSQIVNSAGTEVKTAGKLLAHRQDAYLQMIAMWSTQRTRKEVMPWLPDKERSTILVEMGEKQRKHYDKMLKEFNTVDEHGVEADAQNILARMIRLRQLCQDPAILGLDAPSAKNDALLEYIGNHREPIVIMSWHTSHLNMLGDLIIKKFPNIRVGFITGAETSGAKMATAYRFQSGQIDVLLCNTISAGTGFTLDRSNTVIFLDRPWTPAEQEQAEDRVCPVKPGANMKHSIITIVCKDSIDQHIDALLDQKVNLTAYIKEGGQKIIKELLGNVNSNKRRPIG